MRECCLEAKAMGDQRESTTASLKKVTVLLNPAANKRKSEENFEAYCAPILHLGN
jgi:acylglycerol kinase